MKKNLFGAIPENLPNELIEILYENKGMRIERILSRGHKSADGFWYEQDQDEFVVLISGEAKIRFEAPDETISLKSGDYLTIKKYQRHRVEFTTPTQDCIWLAVFIDE